MARLCVLLLILGNLSLVGCRQELTLEQKIERWVQEAGGRTTVDPRRIDASIKRVTLRECEVSAELVQAISQLKTIRELDLYGARLPKDALEDLSEMSQLSWLNLAGTNLHDADLKFLRRMDVARLALPPATSDQGLAHIEHMKQLHALHLGDTQVTSEGLQRLIQMPKLTELSLANTATTDATLATIAQLTGLEHLTLSHTQVTDRGMPQLLSLRRLDYLSLEGCRVTDASLDTLKQMTHLFVLDVPDTGITAHGVLSLRKALHEDAHVVSDAEPRRQ